jgi:surfactin family lipopeptide synthetase A
MINSGSNHSLDVVDLRNVSRSKRAGSAADLIFEARQVPFNLSTGPLLATKLLRLTDTDYIFLVTIHHIVADYWSMRIFQDELVALYNAFRSRKSPGLLEPPFQFADYACWERRQRSGVLESQLRFWLGQLNEPPPALVFKSDFTSGDEGSRIQRQFVTFDSSHLEKLKAFVANQNTTPFIFVLTVLTVLLYLHTREREIRIGVLAANRHNQSDRTFGYFNNTLVIRTLMSEDLTLDQLLGQMRLSVLNAMSHQELPFEVLLDELERRGIDRCDVFQVLVNYQFALPLDEVDGATFALLDEIRTVRHVPISTYDMVLNFMETSDLLSATVSYRTDACDELVMQALKTSFVGLSKAVLLRTMDRLSSLRKIVQTIA